MIVDLFGVKGLFTSLITRGFVESHLKDKLKFEVVPKDDVGQKFKEAVKKEFNANFLDDSDFVVRFAIPKVEKDPEEDNEENDKEEDKDQEEEKDVENTDDSKEDSEDNKEEVNESVKVQDLSKSVGLQTIGSKKHSSPKKVKCVKETEKKSDKKSCDKNSDDKEDKKENKKENKKEDIEEAETTATGAELKKKIIENIKRTMHSSDDQIELNDLPDYMEGYDVCFVKIGLNNKNKKKDEQ